MALVDLDLNPDEKKLKQFGFIALVAFALLGALVLWKGGLFGLDFGGSTRTVAYVFFALGGGITDNSTARGLTFSGGIGMKFFFGDWFALRFDLRDQVLQQEILGETTIVNNISATMGLSMFMPFSQ